MTPPETPAAALAPAAPPTPLALLQAMIDKGISPDALKQMMDLSERWQRGEAEKLWNQAMTAAQAEMPVVVRDAVNAHLKSKYAKLEAVNAVIKPVYTRHGFALTFGTLDPLVPGTIRVYADVLHAGGFSRRTVADIALDGQGMKGGSNMNAPQATGSTLTYGQRYVTCLIFNVTIADEDTDAVGARVTRAQIEEINAAFAAAESAGVKLDHRAIKDWLQVEDYGDLPQRQVNVLLDHLQRKVKLAQQPPAKEAKK